MRNLIIDDEEAGTFRVHRSVFKDEGLFKAEIEAIFGQSWLYLGHESELGRANDFITRSVAGRSIIFARDSSEVVRAFFNSCRHRGTEVCAQKSGNSARFQCPYHGWTYANDGRLVVQPGRDAYTSKDAGSDLGLVNVPNLSNYKGFYFLNLSRNVQSLEEYLGGAKYYIDLICDQINGDWEVIKGSYLHGMETNWKVLADNSTDLYHLPFTHGRYLSYLESVGTSKSDFKRTGKAIAFENGHAVIQSAPPSGGRPVAYWAPAFPEAYQARLESKFQALVDLYGDHRATEMAHTNRGLFIFPNLILNDNMAVTARTFYPTAIDKVSISLWAFGPKGEERIDRQLRLDSLLTFVGPGGFGTPDDVEILESCQRAYRASEVEWNDLSRGMSRDQPLHTDELQNRTFWRAWMKVMATTQVVCGS
jgi:p-cumate 2,3-dioxygenase alpha subunit